MGGSSLWTTSSLEQTETLQSGSMASPGSILQKLFLLEPGIPMASAVGVCQPIPMPSFPPPGDPISAVIYSFQGYPIAISDFLFYDINVEQTKNYVHNREIFTEQGSRTNAK